MVGRDRERVLELQEAETSINLRTLKSMRTGGLPLGPTVDGDLIPRSPLASLRQGVGGDKPFVVGSADDEFTMMPDRAAKILRWVPRSGVLRLAGLTGDSRTAYLADNADVAALGKVRLAGRVLTDACFRANVLRMLHARGPGPTWAYRFSWPSANNGWPGTASMCRSSSTASTARRWSPSPDPTRRNSWLMNYIVRQLVS